MFFEDYRDAVSPVDVSPFQWVMHVYTGNRFGGIERCLPRWRNPLFGDKLRLDVSWAALRGTAAANADVVDLGQFARVRWQAFGAPPSPRGARVAWHSYGDCHMAIPYALATPAVDDRSLVYLPEFHRGRHWSERWAESSRRPARCWPACFTAMSVSAVSHSRSRRRVLRGGP